MEESGTLEALKDALNSVVPAEYQPVILVVILLVRFSGEAFSAIRNRGGLRGLYRGLILGEGIPRPILEDYEAELKIKPKRK